MSSMSLNMMSFSPRQLFNGGEQGTWYDPSDMSTMFQNAAGTTPVTAVEQPVGLILDKSKGLALGAEIAVNGSFASDTGWSMTGGGWVISGGTANGTTVTGYLYQANASVVVNRYYEVTFTVSNYVSGSVRFFLGQNPIFGTSVSANGTYTQRFSPTINGGELGLLSSAFTGSIDNVSVKEVAGNHARQSTDASRPVLSARVNQLTYTEQFDNAAWPKANATAGPDAGVAPDGTATAEKILETATTGPHAFYNFGISISAAAHTLSVYLKAAERTWAKIAIYDGTNDRGAWFNLSTGAVGTKETGVTAEPAVAVGNGWYRCSITRTTVSGTGGPGFYAATADNVSSYAGTLNSGIYIWGADLRVANDGVNLPAYQRVAAATDYNTSGFPLYLKFDGVDDWLSTGSIDFTATDKMTVFAGARKLSDAAQALLIELSTGVPTNTGSFSIVSPAANPLNTVGFNMRGTGTNQAAILTTAASPVTFVLTGEGDLSIPQRKIRFNSVSAGPDIPSVGTGNFGNYPLYIGRRGGISAPFAGHLYSLIVRGAASTIGQITDTEGWINSSTRAY